MYKNIMFDLDGTLTDSGYAIMSSVKYALSQLGITDQPEEKLRTFVGPSLHDSFIREYGLDEETCQKAIADYRKIYSSELMYEVEVYEGIPELLKILKDKGYVVILITSKPLVFAGKILEKVGLAKYFDHVIGTDLKDPSSDKARLIDRAVKTYDLKKEECLMIGDTKYDVIGAKNYGVDSVGVTYGYGSREELENAEATYISDKAINILEIAGL